MTHLPTDARYPLVLTGRRHALVVGFGPVGRRKAQSLLDAGVRVTILAPDAVVTGLAPVDRVQTISGMWPESAPPLESFDLVFAATNNRVVNGAIALAAKEAGCLSNVADSPEEGDFFTVATIRRGDVLIALSSSGTDPAATRKLREALERWLDGRGVACDPDKST